MKEWLMVEDLVVLGFSFHVANNLLSRSKQYGIDTKVVMGMSSTGTHIMPRKQMSRVDIIGYYTKQLHLYTDVANMQQFLPRWAKRLRLVSND